jgi:hypothetical protein
MAAARLIAALLLVACAPVVAPAPSSLPYVTIDETIPGAVVSRKAAEVFAVKRMQDRAFCEQQLADCGTTAKILRSRAETAEKVAARASWWEQHGLLLTVIVGLVTFFAGAGAGAAVARALAR